jgi:DNA polymerase-3 subunit epsilon
MIRAVLFDTETTGLDPLLGDRVIEVAGIELEGDLPTGKSFHRLINPERDVPEDAVRVHGITSDRLRDAPRFEEIADDLLAFLGDGPLIAHNAAFDSELTRIGREPLDRARMVDTLALARARYPGMPNNLDALCRRFNIDLTERTTHNAVLDCRLLAEVYVELTGGRQRGLDLPGARMGRAAFDYASRKPRTPRLIEPDEEALAAHAAFIATLKNPLW